MNFEFLAPWAPQLRSILRIMTALTFLTHGTQKWFAWPVQFPFPMSSLLYTSATIEIIGSMLLTVGIFSRPVAFILSGLMACAYFIGHAFGATGFVLFPIANRGEAAMLFCFVFLYLAAAGPGPWSVDARLGQGSRGGGNARSRGAQSRLRRSQARSRAG